MLTKAKIFNIAIITGIQYFCLTIVAMFVYPGGTLHDRSTEHYIFNRNFLSDLGRTVALNGEENTAAAVMYAWVLIAVGASTVLLFPSLRSFFLHDLANRILSMAMAVVGALAGVGLISIGVFPSNIALENHLLSVYVAFTALLVATWLLMACIYRSVDYPNSYAHILLFANILLLGYVLLMFLGPSPYQTETGLMIQVTGQKIIVYTLIFSLTFQAIGAKRQSQYYSSSS